MESIAPQAHATLYAQDMLFLTQADVKQFEQAIQAQALQTKYAHGAKPPVAEITAPKTIQRSTSNTALSSDKQTLVTRESVQSPISERRQSVTPLAPSRSLTDLVHNSTQQEQQEERPLDALLPAYRGAYEQQVLIVHRGGRLSDAEDLLLRNLITACQLGLKDVAILDETNLAASSKAGLERLNPKFILSFGINHPFLGGFEAKYKRSHNDLANYIWADDLRDLELDKALKRSLWNVLKEQFNL
ncbi:MAG: hypothetical protein ACXIT9_02610 [Nitritalea sp.]